MRAQNPKKKKKLVVNDRGTAQPSDALRHNQAVLAYNIIQRCFPCTRVHDVPRFAKLMKKTKLLTASGRL